MNIHSSPIFQATYTSILQTISIFLFCKLSACPQTEENNFKKVISKQVELS